MGDFKDLTIEELAASEAELRQWVVAYRELAVEAIHALRATQQAYTRQQEHVRSLRDALRSVRGKAACRSCA